MADDGLITIESRHAVAVTIDRLEAILAAKGIAVFARIDHTSGAASVDLALNPMELLIFGNPRSGTPLMQARPSIGLDLPLKALAWEDEGGGVWLTCNDVGWLARRHRLGAATEPAVAALARLLAELTQAAASEASIAP